MPATCQHHSPLNRSRFWQRKLIDVPKCCATSCRWTTRSQRSAPTGKTSKRAIDHIAALSASVEALPEPTDRDAARDFLTVGQERLESWRQAMTKYAAGKAQADAAAKVHALYGTTTDKALEAIYKEVEAEFRSYYRDINGDDESEFEAQLTPSLRKLGFEVDFYGKGFFPPGAYHSEGHQDGMGLCLYLALMKHLLSDQFTFAVLDDVLMSVDAGHGRKVCSYSRPSSPTPNSCLPPTTLCG